MKKFDLCIIGAGPSGYAAAMRAVDFNKKVALIEKEEIGGAGVTNGALSSKTWWELARNVDLVEKVKRIAAEFEREIATPDEAREMLGLKGLDKVNF